jgi:hypothetical protein
MCQLGQRGNFRTLGYKPYPQKMWNLVKKREQMTNNFLYLQLLVHPVQQQDRCCKLLKIKVKMGQSLFS